MRPGLLVRHAQLPDRSSDLVRCDITGIIGLITQDRWPADAAAGDFIEIVLRRNGDLWDHPDRTLFDRVRRNDTSRPVTYASNKAARDVCFDLCDIISGCL